MCIADVCYDVTCWSYVLYILSCRIVVFPLTENVIPYKKKILLIQGNSHLQPTVVTDVYISNLCLKLQSVFALTILIGNLFHSSATISKPTFPYSVCKLDLSSLKPSLRVFSGLHSLSVLIMSFLLSFHLFEDWDDGAPHSTTFKRK